MIRFFAVPFLVLLLGFGGPAYARETRFSAHLERTRSEEQALRSFDRCGNPGRRFEIKVADLVKHLRSLSGGKGTVHPVQEWLDSFGRYSALARIAGSPPAHAAQHLPALEREIRELKESLRLAPHLIRLVDAEIRYSRDGRCIEIADEVMALIDAQHDRGRAYLSSLELLHAQRAALLSARQHEKAVNEALARLNQSRERLERFR